MDKFEKLIFIDDDEACNLFHEIIVESSDCCNNYKFYLSSVEALEYFAALSKKELSEIPEIIFLDLNMPKMDGWEFLDALNELNLKHYPKIVILTTSSYKKDIEKAENYPLVHKFLCKPLEKKHLDSLREELIVLKE